MTWICKFHILLLIGIASCNDNLLKPLPAISDFDTMASTLENTIKDMCKERGGDNAYKNLKDSILEAQNYIQKNFDLPTIEKDIEVASKTGSMDEVFKKYCDLKTETMKYVHKIDNSLVSCLSDEEKPMLKLVLNVTEGLVDFACYKDGDRIALFIAEDGFTCINSKVKGLQKCQETILGNTVPTTFDVKSVLAITKEQCGLYKKFEDCIVKVLEECSNSTPSNIVESLMTYFYKLSECPTL